MEPTTNALPSPSASPSSVPCNCFTPTHPHPSWFCGFFCLFSLFLNPMEIKL